MQTGAIKWFNFNKGFGFIEPTDKSRDVFLHISALYLAGLRELNEGQKVSFNTEAKNGKVSAIDIKLI